MAPWPFLDQQEYTALAYSPLQYAFPGPSDDGRIVHQAAGAYLITPRNLTRSIYCLLAEILPFTTWPYCCQRAEKRLQFSFHRLLS